MRAVIVEVAIVVVTNSAGEFLVHKRGPSRKTYPGLYGLGAGGKLDSGESPVQAARRELEEETGIVSTPDFLFTFDFGSREITRLHVFATKAEAVKSWDKREWCSCEWMPRAKVQELSHSGQLCPDTKVFFDRIISSDDARFSVA